ncbi:MAG: C25 family cysteine peptidase [Anaerolineales bacterium]|nr:C25 family cysteine peptidase [Anaerolineales bacterium]
MKIKLLDLLVVLSLCLTPVTATRASAASDEGEGYQLSLLRADENGVLVEVSVSGYELAPVLVDGQAYTSLTVKGASQVPDPGAPQLPLITALIVAPAQATVTLQVISEESETLPGNYVLLPACRPAPGEVDEAEPGWLVTPDPAIYAGEAFFPQEAARIGEEAWLGDQRIVRVEVFPFQYHPAQGALAFHSRLRVQVLFTYSGAGARPPRAGARPLDGILEGQVLNFEQAQNWRGYPETNQLDSVQALSSTSSMPAGLKITVDQDGLYKLTYEQLESIYQAAGQDIDLIDASTFSMTNQGRAVAIYLHEDDGNASRFSPGEYILFYGQKFDGEYLAGQFPDEDRHWITYTLQDPATGFYNQTFTPTFNATMLEKYTDENVYWLASGGVPGPRMATRPGAPTGSLPVPETYTTTVHAEKPNLLILKSFTSEDNWFWNEMQVASELPVTYAYTTTLSAIAASPFTATVRGEMVAKTTNDDTPWPDHQVKAWLNDATSLHQDAIWHGKTRYRFEFLLPGDQLALTNTLSLAVYPPPSYTLPADTIWFDWFEIAYARSFQVENNRLTFTRDEGGTGWEYHLGNFTSQVLTPSIDVYDITDPLLPQRVLTPSLVTETVMISGTPTLSTTLIFSGAHPGTAAYLAVAEEAQLSPKAISYYVPQDLLTSQVDYVYITHADLISGTQELADYRTAQGLTTRVIDVSELYDQYLYGIPHPLAIKNYFKAYYARFGALPEYALLVGDGHFNLKHYPFYVGGSKYTYKPIYLPPNLVWVDPWLGEVDSDNMLAADIIPGNTDILPDIKIGRLPLRSNAEVQAYLSKLSAYEASPRGAWQASHLFVAGLVPDEAGNFVLLSDNIIRDYLSRGAIVHRIYENDYGCATSGPYCPAAKYAITATLNTQGALITSYVGHGSTVRWAKPEVLHYSDVSTLDNSDQLTLILSMTCQDGVWDHPFYIGLQEELLRAPARGSIAAYTATGFGVATGHDYLHRGFYDALILNDETELGEAVKSAQLRLFAASAFEDLMHTFNILGDPALKIPIWKLERYTYLPMLRR